MRRSRKWIFTLAAICLFFFCGQYLPEEPLKSKAMAVGFGIDLTEEETVSVHLQILTGSGSKQQSGSNTRVVSAEGATLGEAAYKISRDTGLAVSLTHCNVVILGESLLKSPSVYAVLNYLVCNGYLSDNACLVSCKGLAYDLLSSPIGFGGNASVYMREIIGMYDSFGDITGKKLREFIVDYHRKGQTNWLPFVTRKKVPKETPPSSGGESGGEEESYLFEMNKVAVLVKNKFVGVWDAPGAVAVNCLLNKISKGQLQTIGEHGEKIDWYVLKNDCKLSYDKEKMTVKADLKIQALVKEIVDYSADNAHVDRLYVTEREEKRFERELSDVITSFYAEMQGRDADVFGFKEGFLSHCRLNAEGVPLSDIGLEVNVKLVQT